MIAVQNLNHRYPDGTVALQDINLTIMDGEFMVICGANGSGKTTLIRHFSGLLKPTSGSVTIDGFDIVKQEREAARAVGMVFQDADMQIVGETVREDVAFGPENLGLDFATVKERVDTALRMLGIECLADKPCYLLSGGEKRRLAIAGVLAMGAKTLVLDEPFANLDFQGVRQVLHQIVRLHEGGHTIVLTTHDVEKVAPHATRIAVIHRGRLQAVGPPEEIIPVLPAYGVRQPCYSLFGQKAISWLDG